MRRRTVRILTGVVMVAVVLGIAYAVAVAVSAAKLRRAYDALEKAGRPTQAAQVIPPNVADADNAALLYRSAALLLKAQPAPEKNLLEYLGNLAGTSSDKPLDPNEQAELESLLRQDVIGQAMSILKRGTQRPSCRFDNDYSAGISMPLSHLAEQRALARTLGAKALLHAKDGQADEAWDAALTQLKFADALRAEPIIVSQLVRGAQISLACTTIQRLCETSVPSEPRLRDLQELLGGYDDIAPLIMAADGERLLFGEHTFGLPRKELRDTLDEDDMPDIISRLLFLRVSFKPFFLADHAAYLRRMQDCTNRFSEPYDPNEAGAFDGELFEAHKRHVLTRTLLPALGRVKEVYLRTIAQVRITRAGLVLLQYRAMHGGFPETLGLLDPDGVRDPFSQASLLYRRQGAGFDLYSVGPDQKDNGGIAMRAKQKTDYDIVWHYAGQATP
ncbi:MAG TPA: hypothetical protein PLU87_17705 [Sedimentisphaerales bacterium]|nr:hypothetical protein [Sedimentisphaerales bacterium]HRS12848.1 hypothetical protein [Sedimentisphaerales bacterium]HRV49459.1 hypothetical protein [Sedimentisphaerales bacterium]